MKWRKKVIKTIFGLLDYLVSKVIGSFKDNGSSYKAISKKKIYLWIIDELDNVINQQVELIISFSLPYSFEILQNNFKYPVDRFIIEKIEILKNLIILHNNINVINIGKKIIVSKFKEDFEILYGSVIDGITIHEDRFGNEYEIENMIEELQYLQRSEINMNIKDLILSENEFDYEIVLDNDNYYYTYKGLVRIYEECTNIVINGKKIPQRKIPINWNGSLAEYLAYNCDFFEELNNDLDILEKTRLQCKIVELAEDITSDLKVLVTKIVNKYEQ